MNRYYAAVVVFCLLGATTQAQDGPGFRPAARLPPAALVGTWINASVHAHPGQPDQHFWQRLHIEADGRAVHDYFIADPAHFDLPAASRLISAWAAGVYIDPQPAKGRVAVIRFAPTESWTYDPTRDAYNILLGGMLPTFRLFVLSADEGRLRLSAPAVVEIEGLMRPQTFPRDLEETVFLRQGQAAPSAVEATGWGRIKAAAAERGGH